MIDLRWWLRSSRAVALALALAACAGPRTQALVADPGELPGHAEAAAVPFFPQTENACGPAALAMALAWTGVATSPERVSPLVFTPGRDGSLGPDMLAAARRHGRLAVPIGRLDLLLAELAAGHPVVVLQNLGLGIAPRWHFAVALGYDLGRREILLHSGTDERAPLPLDTFEHTWERAGGWAMVVMPPDTLPRTPSELEVAKAAAGLERAGHPAAALLAYRAMLARWPRSLPAAMGLGNALAAQGDLAAAAAAFAAAAAANPDSAAARHNLAEVEEMLARPRTR